jgi:hypothetical protein
VAQNRLTAAERPAPRRVAAAMATPEQSSFKSGISPRGLWTRIRRHPRRAGFVLFNLVVVVLLVWALYSIGTAGADQWPTLALLYGGVLVIGLLWVGVWISWGVFLLWRHRPR